MIEGIIIGIAISATGISVLAILLPKLGRIVIEFKNDYPKQVNSRKKDK